MKNHELDELVDKSLKIEPGYLLSDGFAQRISLRIARRLTWKSDLLEYLSILAVVVALIGVACGTYFFTNKDGFMTFVELVKRNLIPFILVAFILNFVFFADRVLLRLLFNRWSKS